MASKFGVVPSANIVDDSNTKQAFSQVEEQLNQLYTVANATTDNQSTFKEDLYSATRSTIGELVLMDTSGTASTADLRTNLNTVITALTDLNKKLSVL